MSTTPTTPVGDTSIWTKLVNALSGDFAANGVTDEQARKAMTIGSMGTALGAAIGGDSAGGRISQGLNNAAVGMQTAYNAEQLAAENKAYKEALLSAVGGQLPTNYGGSQVTTPSAVPSLSLSNTYAPATTQSSALGSVASNGAPKFDMFSFGKV